MLEIITSDALSGTRHGFFTRKGGASSGIFAGLNCGTGSSDLSDAVAINRARVAQAMELPLSHLATVYGEALWFTDDEPLLERRRRLARALHAVECRATELVGKRDGQPPACYLDWLTDESKVR